MRNTVVRIMKYIFMAAIFAGTLSVSIYSGKYVCEAAEVNDNELDNNETGIQEKQYIKDFTINTVDAPRVGNIAPAIISNYNNMFKITDVEWKCEEEPEFKAGDVFNGNSTYTLILRLTPNDNYEFTTEMTDGGLKYNGSYFVWVKYDNISDRMEDNSLVLEITFKTDNVIKDLYFTLDKDAWTKYIIGQYATKASKQFADEVINVDSKDNDRYCIDRNNSYLGQLNNSYINYNLNGRILLDAQYVMCITVLRTGDYTFDSITSEMNIYLNGEKVAVRDISYNSNWDMYYIYIDAPAPGTGAVDYDIKVNNGTTYDNLNNAISVSEKDKLITLVADNPAKGKVFDKWVCSDGNVVFNDENNATTTFVMPDNDVEITAEYRNADESVIIGWKEIDGKMYHFNEEGIMDTSKWIDNKYYVKEDGAMAVSEIVDNGNHYVDSQGRFVYTTKWIMIDNAWYYVITGTIQKNKWLVQSKKWYYFGADGVMLTSQWQKINGKWYYFDADGVMQTSKWISGKYYVKADGTMAVSGFADSGKYYVDANGRWIKATKWLKVNNKWHYIVSGRVQQSKWLNINGKWYYFGTDGVMQTSKWISGKYYVKDDGTMAISEWVDAGKYYVGADGKWIKGYDR